MPAATPSGCLNTAVAATRTFTPADTAPGAVSAFTPPSTSRSHAIPRSVMAPRTCRIFGNTESMNLCPENPGLTDMTRTRSSSSMMSSSTGAGVAGFRATPACLPLSLTDCTTLWRWGVFSWCTMITSAPASMNTSTYRSGSSIIRWASRGRSVRESMASTMKGPMEMFGTNRPSMTSIWIRSAPARSTARTSSARRVKSADRMDGEIWITVLPRSVSVPRALRTGGAGPKAPASRRNRPAATGTW